MGNYDIVMIDGEVSAGELTKFEASWLIYYSGGTVVRLVRACRNCMNASAEFEIQRINESSSRTLLYLCIGDSFTGEASASENCSFCRSGDERTKVFENKCERQYKDVLVVGMSWLLLTICNFSV